MTIHIPGSTVERSVDAAAEVLQAAFTAARQKFGDDIAQTEMFIKLAFEWQYYLKANEVMTVEALVRNYAALRSAPPKDVADLQERLKQFHV